MIINEKAMVRQLKAAYKSGGYTVAGLEKDGVEELLIYAGHWLAHIRRRNVPKSVLAAIVSHTGTIPATGEAYRIRKNDVQTFLCDEAVKVAGTMAEKKQEEFYDLQKTPLTYQDWEIWQSPEDLGVLLFNPEYTAMATLGSGCRCADVGHFLGEVSELYVLPIQAEKRLTKEVLRHLSGMQWIA